MRLEQAELPDWYPLRRVSGKISVEEMLDLGKKKIDLLLELAKDPEKIMLTDPDPRVEAIGGLVLRIATAVTEDRFFQSWLIESEGDLLSIRFQHAKLSEKLMILRDLFGDFILGWGEVTSFFNTSKDEIWQEIYYLVKDHYKKKKDLTNLFNTVYNSENGVIAVRFWEAPRLIKRKRGILRKGWLITFTDYLIRELKWKFQKKLEKHIKKLIEEKRQGSEKLLVLQDIMNELMEYWRSKRDIVSPKREFALKGKKLYERPELWPLCMRMLLSRLESTGYLPHGERLQLGLFLKRLGMTLEEQMEFWYKFSVDNVGIPWDEFEKKGGYHIRHIYGVVGSRKDYEAPKCETIISKYFCPYKNLSSAQLREVLRSFHPDMDEKILRNILEKARLGEATQACKLHLFYVSKRGYKLDEITHPLQFVRLAFMSRRRKKNEDTANAGENSE